ncbi:MAG: hypothetical protein ACTSQG_10615 [Promethearchaeota archaeon]
MVRIKGWEKIGRYSWLNKKKDLTLRVVKPLYFRGYDVTIQKQGFPPAIVYGGEGFSNIDDAEKFAIHYMKTHPRG